MHSVLVLSYYHPWVAGGGHRPRRLMTEDLRRGRHIAFLYVEPTNEAMLEGSRGYEPNAENLHVAQASFDGPIQFGKMSGRWRGAVAIDRFLHEFRPAIVRVHNPSEAHISVAARAHGLGIPILYDQMDLWDAFAAQPWGMAGETWYVENAGMISVVSSYLATRLPGKNVCVVPNGVSEAFIQACHSYRVKMRSRPIYDVVYAGALWPNWIDWELIEALIETASELRWCFVGAADPPAHEDHGTGAQMIINRLALRPNVHVMKEVDHADLAAILVNSRVGLVPFKSNPLTLSASPIKVYDYLAAGLPVVCFDTPEVGSIEGVSRCTTVGEYLDAIRHALSWDACDKESMKDQLNSLTWSRRLDDLDQFVQRRERNGSP